VLPAIKVEGVWKEYVVGASRKRADTFYESLSNTLAAPFKRLRGESEVEDDSRFWALKDVSFEVQPGDVVGVIGRNGAGKSTLLKILSRITAPTKGRIEVRGRLASLLEVGTGFHPELSGRENIFLNGAILGMTRRDIQKKFDEIVAFAEVEKFIDTPVKRYSSGMYVRLAFAVAAHLEPDILIVDEVLAVGDSHFQSKCLGKLGDVSAKGRTVLIVSHNLSQLAKLCQSAVALEAGQVVGQGRYDFVSNQYLVRGVGAQRGVIWLGDENAYGFQYKQVQVLVDGAVVDRPIPQHKQIEIDFVFNVTKPMLSTRLAIALSTPDGSVVLASSSTDSSAFLSSRWDAGEHRLRCSIPSHLLSPGQYFLSVSRPTETSDAVLERVCTFDVALEGSLRARDNRQGAVEPLLEWKIL
jgi:lipopolysaccharide transport system ATP-binding protein